VKGGNSPFSIHRQKRMVWQQGKGGKNKSLLLSYSAPEEGGRGPKSDTKGRGNAKLLFFFFQRRRKKKGPTSILVKKTRGKVFFYNFFFITYWWGRKKKKTRVLEERGKRGNDFLNILTLPLGEETWNGAQGRGGGGEKSQLYFLKSLIRLR